MPRKRFQDKVVFITGASSGIGEALARAFSKEGAKVVATARRLDRLQDLVRDLQSLRRPALAISCDVTSEESLRKAVQTAVDEFGKIDVVIANAGFGVAGPFHKLKLADFQRQFDINVFGVLRTVYATLGELNRNRGTLAIMGSIAGHISAPQGTPYCMSKFAVRALAEGLYMELASHGIAVVLISPGFVKSEIYKVTNKGVLSPDQKDPVPEWLKMNTRTAARQIVDAIARKERERVITLHGKILLLLHKLLPGLFFWFFKTIAQWTGKSAVSLPPSIPKRKEMQLPRIVKTTSRPRLRIRQAGGTK